MGGVGGGGRHDIPTSVTLNAAPLYVKQRRGEMNTQSTTVFSSLALRLASPAGRPPARPLAPSRGGERE